MVTATLASKRQCEDSQPHCKKSTEPGLELSSHSRIIKAPRAPLPCAENRGALQGGPAEELTLETKDLDQVQLWIHLTVHGKQPMLSGVHPGRPTHAQ